MGSFRNHMDKILKDIENDVVITNPNEQGKTFLRRTLYIMLLWIDNIKKFFKMG